MLRLPHTLCCHFVAQKHSKTGKASDALRTSFFGDYFFKTKPGGLVILDV